MLFSIITPIYNTKKYLKKCIDSVCGQSYKDFELILIDDGSTDGSSELCDIYSKRDSRIRVIHQTNGGQGSARNHAIVLAKGEYLLFLDSDDYIDKGLLQQVSEMIEKYHPQLIVYAIKMSYKRNLDKRKFNESLQLSEQVMDREVLWKEYLEGNKISGCIGNKCIERRALTENKIFFPEIRMREDAYFLLNLFQNINMAVVINYVGYYQYMRYGSTEQQKFNKNFLVSLEIRENYLKYVQSAYPQLYRCAYQRWVMGKIYNLALIRVEGKSKIYDDEAEKIRNSLSEDLKVLKGIEECEEIYEMIENIFGNTKEWKKYCRNIANERCINRIKGFLYAKVINFYSE